MPPAASPTNRLNVSKTSSLQSEYISELTILLDDVLAWRDELSESLELVSGHGAVAAFLEGQVSLKVGIEVLLECDIADEAHAT